MRIGVSHVRAKILRLFRINEGFAQFHGHPLLRLWSSPGTDVSSISRHASDWLLFNVAAHTDNAHIIRILEVVAQIQLVEVERDAELSVTGREEGCAGEGDHKLRPVF